MLAIRTLSPIHVVRPIITNRAALTISQSFGATEHPGGLVRTWVPRSAPSAPPNRTEQWPWALNADPAAISGWTVAAPAGTAGPVVHRTVDADGVAGELCLTAPVVGRDKNTVLLSGCTVPAAPSQSWVLEPNGSLHLLAAHAQACLVLANGRGPQVELFRCKPGGNEAFNYSHGNGTLCSHTVSHGGAAPATKCLSARNAPASGDSGDGTMQLWAKPQPVRQLRHHFGPSLRDVWALYHPPHAVDCALLGYRAYWMLIGVCDSMLWPIHVVRGARWPFLC